MTAHDADAVEQLMRAALAVVQAAHRINARGGMLVPDFQIQKLKAAMQRVEQEETDRLEASEVEP